MTRSADPAERALWLYYAIPVRDAERPLITVERGNVQSNQFALDLLDADPPLWQQEWRITYKDEEGIDAGGLSRAWVASLLDEMLAPEAPTPAFRIGKTYTYFNEQHPTLIGAEIHPVRRQEVERFGRLFGRSIMLGMTTGIELPPHLLDLLASRSPQLGLSGLAKFDPDLAKVYQAMLDYPDYIDENLTFSVEESNGKPTALHNDIDPKTRVTKDNVRVYVDAMVEYVLLRKFAGATEIFLRAVYDVVDPRVFQGFSAPELVEITAGRATFDTDAWRKASTTQVNVGIEQQEVSYDRLQEIVNNKETEYGDAPKRAQLVEWFFEALDSFGDEERGTMFKAVTTNKRVPGAGFAALAEPFLFKFTKDVESSGNAKEDQPFAGLGLPRAATCDNSISIPDYPDADTVKAALKTYLGYLSLDPTFNAE